jgi:hypothetical protein
MREAAGTFVEILPNALWGALEFYDRVTALPPCPPEPCISLAMMPAGPVGGWANFLRGMSSRVLLRTPAQLQAKFKHAGVFGVTGNYNKVNAVQFSRAINMHINSPSVIVIKGSYHGIPATHYLDPWTGLNVVEDAAGYFWTGWKLGNDQLRNVLMHGGL